MSDQRVGPPRAPEPTLTLDFTSVSPDSGGVGVVAGGVARGLKAEEIPFRCVISSDHRQAWLERFPDLETSLHPVGIRLRATSPWQRALRRFVPRSSRLAQLAIGRVRAARARSSSKLLGDDVVWQPFHRVPLRATRGIVTVHDLRVFEPGLESQMDQRIVEHNVRHASAIVCSWPHPYNGLIERFPLAREKTFLIPLPVLNPGPWQHHAAPLDGRVRLLLPGFVTPHKNHEVVIRALVLLPGAHAVFTGAEDGRYGDQLRDLAARLGVCERIDWLGYVDAARLEKEYADADLLVMPTRWEAASGPIFESIVRGLPFVASDIPPITSQLEVLGLRTETFDCDSPEEFVAAIQNTLLSYTGSVQRLRRLSVVLRERTWAQMAAEYHRVFAWVGGTGEKPEELMNGVAS